jgi:hypothetical protein
MWALSNVGILFKTKGERMFGSIRDLLYITAVFVALKLDGYADYSWTIVFLIPWMWFGALFLAALMVSKPKGTMQLMHNA